MLGGPLCRALGLDDHDDVVDSRECRESLGHRPPRDLELVSGEEALCCARKLSLDAACGKFEVVRQLIEVDRMPAAAERPELAREGNARQVTQAGIFQEKPKQIEMEQVRKFDGQLHRAVMRARLKSQHEPLEAVRFLRHD